MDSSESEVLETLGNKYNPEILDSARRPKSAQELSDELDIPIATCYRRIEELQDTGLLELEDKVLSDEGRRTKVYRTQVNEIRILFEGNGTPRIEMDEITDSEEKLVDIWDDLKRQ
ncbi:helix-turn-helix domain-containing protein [Halorutilales archaeon Cl-col2-1]